MKDWLLQFWHKFVKLLPRYVIVKKGQGGVLLFCGNPREVVGPGIYFLMPIFDDCDVINVVSQSIDLENVLATTKDDKSVLVSAIVKYSIDDIEEALYSIYDYDQELRNEAEASLVRAFSQTTWIGRDQGQIEDLVATDLILEVKTHGIGIDSVRLNGVGKTRSLHITHRSSTASRSGGRVGVMTNGEE